MAVKKSSKKAGAKKASPKSKTGAKLAAPAKKAAAKSKTAAGAGAKKASPKRKTGAKPAAPAKKTAARSEPAAAVEKGSPAPKPAKSEPTKKTTKGKFSSMSVNLGHVFSLRPRVNTSFRQADFLTARLLLQDEAYESIEEAARAVVEKALDRTHEAPSKRGFKPGR